MQTPEALIARNVAELRDERGHTVRSLSAVLGQLGHPMLPSAISKIENHTRRVDVGDLVALSLALGVTPNRLLLPADDRGEEVALTSNVSTTQWQAWGWAEGQSPLLSAAALIHGEDAAALELIDDFHRHTRPVDRRLREQHTAMKAARDVTRWIDALLSLPDLTRSGTGTTTDKLTRADNPKDRLRRALKRLTAEVEDLIGDDDGQR